MDQEIVNTLRQAATDIKEGKLKTARTTLVALLRDHPEVDQAWYMLSFTVPVLERQVYALEQALKVNPQNEKALTRLQKLKGEKPPVSDAFSFRSSKKESAEKKAPEPSRTPASSSGEDLLSRRLLGGVEEEVGPPAEVKAEPEQEPVQVTEEAAVEPVVEEIAELQEDAKEKTKEEKKAEKDEKYRKKVFGMRRGVFLLVMLILIFFSLEMIAFTPQIKQFVAGLQGGGNGNAAQNEAGDDDGALAAGTEEATATSEVDLPPVWTPTATIASTPTPEPEPEVPQLGDQIIDLGSLPAPDDAVLSDFEQIRVQLNAMMEGVELPELQGYLVSQEDLQGALTEFARLSDYRNKAAQLGSFYVGLGMADSVLSTNAVMENMWADPNGTLYFPDTDSVILVDFDLSQYQRFSYAESLVQNFRNSQVAFEDLGVYPMCSPINQECEVLYALIKGEAAYFANSWADEYMGEGAAEEFSTTDVNPYTASPEYQAPFMDSLFVLPGTYGADLIAGVYEQGGFDALNGLYLNLPATTEQLMHLDKYLADEQPKAVEPAMISGELGAAWQEVFQGTLGEWKTYQLLTGSLDENARMPEDISQVAAAGWGGDHAQIFFRNSTQEYVVVVEWVWDTPADRTEFADAFTQSVSSKTGASAADLVSGFSCYQNSAGIDCVLNAGQSVVWLQAPDESTMLLLLSAYS